MYDMLAFAIIQQAVEDYKYCKENQLPTKRIEEFLKSTWCDTLLQNMRLSGDDILMYLRIR